MKHAYLILLTLLSCVGLHANEGKYAFRTVNQLPVIETLPDPFIMEDGSRVQTAADWGKQREYLKAMIQHYLFGFRPPTPKHVDVEVSGTGSTRTLKFTVHAPSGKVFSFDAGMFIPPGEGPFPVVIRNDRRAEPPQTEMAAKRGYIVISYNRTQLDEDQSGPKSKTNNRYPAQEAFPDYSWETIMCWSWGNSVIIDWLETQPYVDPKGIVVTGHSRGGKTALLAGIMDERIALAVPNGSGAGGSGNFRFGDFGGAYKDEGIAESLSKITRSFPYWFAPELNTFRGQETRLPFDLHTLKALMAPRGLLSADGTEDWWANPKNSQRTTEAAKEVYKFLGVPEKIGHHFRAGGHNQNTEDWTALFDFADFIIRGKPLPPDFYAKNYPFDKTQWNWEAPAPPAVNLLADRELTGWVQRGGSAKFAVEGDEIVGTSVADTPNSFLCTGKTYGDFVLEYEFKVDPTLNSGVQIRSQCFDAPTEFVADGKTIQIPAGRVHGYQVEIDVDPAKDRWWSAGLYDEGRRGWLFPGNTGDAKKAFTDQGRAISKPNDWNRVRVEAIGDTIRTWLNGVPRAEIRDGVTARGFIALQVHSIGKDAAKAGLQVRWRNLRLTDLAPAANTLSAAEKAEGWKLLWDGKTTAGWRSAKADTFPKSGWEIRDGELRVLASGGGESTAGGDIITVDRYSQFELKVDFKITPGANSGIKYFCQPNLDPITGAGAKSASGKGSAIGLEFQILDDERHPDAKLGRDGNRTIASLYDLLTASRDKQPSPIGEWNTAHVIVRGAHVEHWLNGLKVLEYERGSAEFRDLVARSKYKKIPGFGEWTDGHILLQDHGNEVHFRNIKIRVPAN